MKYKYNCTWLNIRNISLPVEQHVGLCILHHRLMDFRYILIIKLIPLAVDDVLTVSYVVSTCVESGGREGV